MNEQYLWDGTGDPDPEIASLEETLSPLQYRPKSPHFGISEQKSASRRRLIWSASLLSAAAALALAVWFGLSQRVYKPVRNSAWKISWAGERPRPLHTGQTIDTRNESAQLESDFVGEVRVDAKSRLRIAKSTNDEQRLELQHGTIHAMIWAPPKQFVVDTPSSTTIDLGCKYTLEVAADGSGFLQVEAGWVAFQWRDIESFIPAGAACATAPGRGPGTPYFEDAPAALRPSIARFEHGDAAALGAILADARPRDALTLWHLLSRTHRDERGKVFDRLSQLVQMPRSVTREKVMAGDPAAFDAAWNALNLGDTNWWREWKRRW